MEGRSGEGEGKKERDGTSRLHSRHFYCNALGPNERKACTIRPPLLPPHHPFVIARPIPPRYLQTRHFYRNMLGLSERQVCTTPLSLLFTPCSCAPPSHPFTCRRATSIEIR